MADNEDVVRRLRVVMETSGLSEGHELLQAIADAGGNVEAALKKIATESKTTSGTVKDTATAINRMAASKLPEYKESRALKRDLDLLRDFAQQYGKTADGLKLANQLTNAVLSGSPSSRQAAMETLNVEKRLQEEIKKRTQREVDYATAVRNSNVAAAARAELARREAAQLAGRAVASRVEQLTGVGRRKEGTESALIGSGTNTATYAALEAREQAILRAEREQTEEKKRQLQLEAQQREEAHKRALEAARALEMQKQAAADAGKAVQARVEAITNTARALKGTDSATKGIGTNVATYDALVAREKQLVALEAEKEQQQEKSNRAAREAQALADRAIATQRDALRAEAELQGKMVRARVESITNTARAKDGTGTAMIGTGQNMATVEALIAREKQLAAVEEQAAQAAKRASDERDAAAKRDLAAADAAIRAARERAQEEALLQGQMVKARIEAITNVERADPKAGGTKGAIVGEGQNIATVETLIQRERQLAAAEEETHKRQKEQTEEARKQQQIKDRQIAQAREHAEAEAKRQGDMVRARVEALTGVNRREKGPGAATVGTGSNVATIDALKEMGFDSNFARRAEEVRAQYDVLSHTLEKLQRDREDLQAAFDAGLFGDDATAAERLARSLDLVDEKQRRVELDFSKGNDRLRLSAHQWMNFGQQLQDVFTMATNGASLFQISTTQGPQIFDIFQRAEGGFAGGMKAVVAGFKDFALSWKGAVTGATAAIVAGVYAWDQYAKSVKAVEISTYGLGRATGATVDQLVEMGNAAAKTGDMSRKEARATIAAYASTGQITLGVMEDLTSVTKDFAATTGQDLESARKSLADMFSDPAQGAEKLKQALGALDAFQVRAIQRLAAQGDALGAQKAMLDATTASTIKYEKSLSPMGRFFGGIAKLGSDIGDKVGEVFDPSLAVKIKQTSDEISTLQDRVNRQQGVQGGGFFHGWGVDKNAIKSLDEAKKKLTELQDEQNRPMKEATDGALRSWRDNVHTMLKSLDDLDTQIEDTDDRLARIRQNTKDLGKGVSIDFGSKKTSEDLARQARLDAATTAQQVYLGEAKKAGGIQQLEDVRAQDLAERTSSMYDFDRAVEETLEHYKLLNEQAAMKGSGNFDAAKDKAINALFGRQQFAAEINKSNAEFQVSIATMEQYERAAAEIVHARQLEIDAAGRDEVSIRKLTKAREADLKALHDNTVFQQQPQIRASELQVQIAKLYEYESAIAQIDAKFRESFLSHTGNDEAQANDLRIRRLDIAAAHDRAVFRTGLQLEQSQFQVSIAFMQQYERAQAEIVNKYDLEIRNANGAAKAVQNLVRARNADLKALHDNTVAQQRPEIRAAQSQAAVASMRSYAAAMEQIDAKFQENFLNHRGNDEAQTNDLRIRALELLALKMGTLKQAQDALRESTFEGTLIGLDQYAQGLERIAEAYRKIQQEHKKKDGTTDPDIAKADKDKFDSDSMNFVKQSQLGIARQVAPEAFEQFDLHAQIRMWQDAILDPSKLRELGVSAQDAAIILERLQNKFDYFKRPIDNLIEDFAIQEKAIAAVSLQEKIAADTEKTLAEQRRGLVTDTEAAIKIEIQRGLAIAQATRAMNDALRDARDASRLIGRKPYQAAQEQLQIEREKAIRDQTPDGVETDAIRATFNEKTRQLNDQFIGSTMRDNWQQLSENMEMTKTHLQGLEMPFVNSTAKLTALTEAQRLYNEFSRAGVPITDDLQAKIQEYASAAGEAAVQAERLASRQQLVSEFKSTGGDALKGFINDLRHGKSLAESFTSAIDKLTDKLIDLMVNDFFDPKAGGIWEVLTKGVSSFLNGGSLFPNDKTSSTPAFAFDGGKTFNVGVATINVGALSGAGLTGLFKGTDVPATQSLLGNPTSQQGVNANIGGSLVPNAVYPTGGAALSAEAVRQAEASLRPGMDLMGKVMPSPQLRSAMEAMTREVAAQYGHDPDIFARVIKEESSFNPYSLGDNGTSFGLGQLHIGGGIGDDARRMGIPLDASGARAQLELVAQRIKTDGWTPWNGAKNSGVGKWDGVNRTPMGANRTPGPQALNGDVANDNLVGSTEKLSGGFDDLSRSTQDLAPNFQDLTSKVGQAAPELGKDISGLGSTIGNGGQNVGGALADTSQTIAQGSTGIGGALSDLASALKAPGGGGGGFGGLGSLFSGGGSGSGGGWNDFLLGDNFTSGWDFGISHEGGAVGDFSGTRNVHPSVFMGAPRYHKGMRPDEVPTILQQGEWVLSRDDVANIKKGGRGGGYTNDNGPRVVINNHGPTQAHAEEKPDGSIEVIVESLESRMADKAARGRGSLYKASTGRAAGRNLRG